MRGVVLVGLSACGFTPSQLGAAPIDAPSAIDVDAPRPIDAPIDPCAGTLLCFTFDQNPLPASLPNGGSAPVSAQVTDVTPTQGEAGSAAEMSSSSMIYVPSVAQLSGVLAYDYWVRVDQTPGLGGRYGIIDTAVAPGFDSFYYDEPTSPEIRCSINSNDYLYGALQSSTAWTHVACTCDPPNLSLYINGTLAATQNLNCMGAKTTDGYGIQLGADNVDGPGYTDDILQGAIDDMRLYTAPLTASQVCKLAGTC